MAYGKADVGLIQADRAAQTVDPMLGLSTAIGNVVGGMAKNYSDQQAAGAKQRGELNKKWEKIASETMDGNNDLTRNQRRDLKKLYRQGRSSYVNAADGADRDEVQDVFLAKMNLINNIGSQQKQSQSNGGNFGPGFDGVDQHYSTLFSNDEYENVEVDGVSLVKIKAPKGSANKYEYFTPDNLPVATNKWSDGGAAVMGNWNEELTNRVKWDGEMEAGTFADKYKESLTVNEDGSAKKMNYFQAQDLISSDHSKDGKKNSFYDMFTTGNMSPDYFKGLDGEFIQVPRGVNGNGDAQMVAYDPSKGAMGGLTKEELNGYIKGFDAGGRKDYRNMSKINEFITDKYSTFMGEVTKDEYDKQQKSKMEANNRYFVSSDKDDPTGFSRFGSGTGTFPTDKKVLAKKKEELVNMKFETATSANMMSITGDGPQDVSQDKVQDWNKFKGWKEQVSDGGDLIGNLSKAYNYNDVEISGEDGVITVGVGTGNDVVGQSFDFTDKNTDKNELMAALKKHLSTSKFDDYNELGDLGNDANTWGGQMSKNNTSILQQLGTKDASTIKRRNMDRSSEDFSYSILSSKKPESEEDVLQALNNRSKEKNNYPKGGFKTKEDYKKYFMNNGGGGEAQFKFMWDAYLTGK